MTIRMGFFDTIERTQFFQNYSFTFISRKNLKDLDAKIFHGNIWDSHHLLFKFLMQFRICLLNVFQTNLSLYLPSSVSLLSYIGDYGVFDSRIAALIKDQNHIHIM